MQFLLSLFLSDFDDGDGDNNQDGNHSSASSPPMTPQDRFKCICRKIETNDSNVKRLDLTHNHVDFPRLARSLAGCQVVQDLSLKETMMSKPEQDIDTFFREGLGRNRSLVSLNLTGNPLMERGIEFLNRSLNDHPTLQILKLCRWRLCDSHVAGLGRIGIRLKELDLSTNRIETFRSLFRLLAENHSLETLDLSNNKLLPLPLHTSSCDDGKLEEEDTVFGTTTTTIRFGLRSLNLSSNRFTPPSALGLNRLLKNGIFEDLVELNLSWNDLGDEGIVLLAPLLAHIRKVDLTRCGLKPAGARRLAESLCSNCSNGGGDDDTHSMSPLLLHELSLNYNDIGEEGVLPFVEYRTTIRVLDVERTRIRSGEGVVKAMVHNNTNLHRILMNRNPINRACKRAIAFWTEVNASGMRRLVMEDEAIRTPGFWAFILEKSSGSASLLYYVLRQKPDICLFRRQEEEG